MNLALAALVVLAAFFVQGFAGFGAALIMTPLLALLIDLKLGVIAASLVQLPLGLWLTLAARQHIERNTLLPLLPLSVPGVWLGSWALAQLDLGLLRRLCGLLTMLFALRMLFVLRAHSARRRWPAAIGYLAGGLGGLLGGLFGTSGPPVVVFLENQLAEKEAIRATLLAYFLVVNLVRIASYGSGGLFGPAVFVTALALLPSALIGSYLGMRLHGRASAGSFRLAIALLLLATGTLLVLQTEG